MRCSLARMMRLDERGEEGGKCFWVGRGGKGREGRGVFFFGKLRN